MLWMRDLAPEDSGTDSFSRKLPTYVAPPSLGLISIPIPCVYAPKH